ncbi:MAG: class I SAM-dependent methyltransferase [Chloroflexi bacterium]|nr:class I SAM-dependent methyltransferase [Chloroflexota bacterium]
MNDILQEQLAYYRARAAEYDEWFYRHGRYDRGAVLNQQWFAEAAQVRQALHQLPPQPSILELAPGTGIWTQELVKLGERITAVDASPEMVAINQVKVQSDAIEYIQDDLFEWHSPRQYDMVFFGFWLSHVPPEKLAGFLAMVSAALKPDGVLFMVDSRREPTSTADNHVLPDEGIRHERKLNDGSTYRIVKLFYEPEALQAAFAEAGIALSARFTETYFIYAQGRKA